MSCAIDDKTILQIDGDISKNIIMQVESLQLQKAADWVKKNYENTNHRYLVTLNLNSKNLRIVLKLSIKLINLV